MAAFEPTARQQEIRDFAGPSLLVLAPAGCGKTEALALRVKGLVEQRASRPPRKVLLVTFTNRSKENLDQRLRTHLSEHEVRTHVVTHNLHGLSARIIRAHGGTVGIGDEWALPAGDWVGDQCRSRSLNFKQSTVVKQLLQQAKLTTRTDDEVAQFLRDTQHPVAIAIEQKRIEDKQLTYDDLPRFADLILRDETIARLYREHFSYVVVDEFQDLTLQQLSLLQSFAAGRTTYAGDIAQGIYTFAGANPQAILAAVGAETPEQITFAESHRSSPAVLDLVNSLIPLTEGVALTSSKPESWPGGGLATHRDFSSNEDEAAGIVKIATFILSKAPGQRIGVMTRTKPRRQALDALLDDDLGFKWYRWEDPVFDSNTAPILRRLLRRATPADLQDPDLVELLMSLVDPSQLQDPGTLESVLTGCKWIADLANSGHSAADIRGRIKIGEGEQLLEAPGLHLLTGHAGKGQQFDWVIIMGLESDSIPGFQATTPAAQVEEARVLSVMISRARHGVITTRSLTAVKPWGDVNPTQPSLFAPYLEASPSRLAWSDAVDWLKASDWSALSER